MKNFIQVPWLALPRTFLLPTDTELINDLVEHTSLEFPTRYIQEKQVHILASEVVGAGVPGVLNAWIELSPYLSTTSTAYWAAIGGGGGALAPVAPVTEVATGVNGTIHTLLLPWTQHSEYARVVIQTPIAAGLPLAFWAVQVIIGGKAG